MSWFALLAILRLRKEDAFYSCQPLKKISTSWYKY